MELGGLHHLTAVTADAKANVDFYTRVLGMRLVKKTVNQDDVSAYHLFYADGDGNPGTEVTFFDWPMTGPRRSGSGEVSEVGLRVPDRAALDYWVTRLNEAGVHTGEITRRLGRDVLTFTDPEGQRLALVAATDDIEFTPWARGPVPVGRQVRGLGHVILTVRNAEPTARVLTGVMGFRAAGEYPLADPVSGTSRIIRVFEVGGGGVGREVHIDEQPDLAAARLGSGGVHHVAFRVPNDAEQLQWRDHVRAAGLGITDQIDRFYFKSLYFREPGRVLFELATDGPGFATDEDREHMGEGLALPPFLEPRRAEIEAGLEPLPTEHVAAR